MALICSMNCDDVIFDIYDNERIPIGLSKNKYYVTPKLSNNIQLWMLSEYVEKVGTKEQMAELIKLGFIGTY